MSFLLLSIFISSAFAAYDAHLVSYNIPANVEPGKIAAVSVVVNTTGGTINSSAYLILYTGSMWNNSSSNKYSSKKTVTQNNVQYIQFTFNFNITGPATPGNYTLGWNVKVDNWTSALMGGVQVGCSYLPSQFIAKLYSEANGRAPDQGGWNTYHQYFRNNPCNLASLQSLAVIFFTSAEYNNLGYDNEEKILTLYRALLSRDPDNQGFHDWVAALNAGNMKDIVNSCSSSSEFAGLVSQIYSGYSYGWKTYAVPNYTPTWTVPPVPPGSTNIYPFPAHAYDPTTGTALKTLLDPRQPGNIVLLPEKLIVVADVNIVIPKGVTLETYSPTANPITRNQYARFARIVRSTSNIPTTGYTSLVTLNNGARLEHVFVDGSQSEIGYNPSLWASYNILLNGGTSTTVNECRSSNVLTCSPICAINDNVTISKNVCITNNLVDCYVTTPVQCSDGITNGCLNAIISGNYIIDATDVAIVTFGYYTCAGYTTTPIQNSVISGNTIVNAGNSCGGALELDGGTQCPTKSANNLTMNFSNCTITNNNIMMGAGPQIHYQIIFQTNSRAFFGDGLAQVVGGAFPAKITNNSTLGTVNCNVGIMVDDINNVTVTGNNFTTNLVNSCGLPLHRVVKLTNTITNSTIQSDGDTYSTTNASLINGKWTNFFMN